jgi:glycosyltransferase 2 family protein
MPRVLKFAVGFAISAVCLVLAFRKVPLDQVWAAITGIPARTLVACFLLGSTTLFLRALRWRILLAARAPLGIRIVYQVNSAGQLGNVVLPARLGDLFRATNLGRAGFDTGFTLATVFVERVLDAGFLVMIASIILASSAALPPWLARGARLLAIAAVAGLLGMLILPRIESSLAPLVQHFLPHRWQARADIFLNQFLKGLRSFQHPGRASSFLLLTAVIWMLDSAGVVVIGTGLGHALSPFTAVLLISALALASAIPAAPGNLGVYQLVVISVLGTAGIAREPALSLALIMQAMMLVMLLAWGLPSFWALSVPKLAPVGSLETP